MERTLTTRTGNKGIYRSTIERLYPDMTAPSAHADMLGALSITLRDAILNERLPLRPTHSRYVELPRSCFCCQPALPLGEMERMPELLVPLHFWFNTSNGAQPTERSTV